MGKSALSFPCEFKNLSCDRFYSREKGGVEEQKYDRCHLGKDMTLGEVGMWDIANWVIEDQEVTMMYKRAGHTWCQLVGSIRISDIVVGLGGNGLVRSCSLSAVTLRN